MRAKSISLLGWYGVLVILLGYCLISFGFVTSGSVLYQVLNLTGALGIITETLAKKDYQPTALNIVWAAIAIVALARILL